MFWSHFQGVFSSYTREILKLKLPLGPKVKLSVHLPTPYSVFLVDHAWTYRMEYARQQLEQVPGLLPRMAALMGVDFHGEAPDPDTVEVVMECMWKYNQTYQLSLGVSAKPPLAISLFTDVQTSSQVLTAATVGAVVESSAIKMSLLNQTAEANAKGFGSG